MGKISLPEIQDLAANYVAGSFCLSALSQAAILAAIAAIENTALWVGADGFTLTATERHDVEEIIDDASAEMNTGEACIMFHLPAGTIIEYAGATIPTNWLDCNGASLLRATYPDLFAAIGTTWGAVDGTHFTLPDMRGRAAIGDGTGTGLSARTLAQIGGTQTHTLSVGELPAHNHAVQTKGSDGTASNAHVARSSDSTTGPDSFATNNQGGGLGHNNMQPFVVVKNIIYTGIE